MTGGDTMRKIGLLGALLGALALAGPARADKGGGQGQQPANPSTGLDAASQQSFGPGQAKNGDAKGESGTFAQDPTGKRETERPTQGQPGSAPDAQAAAGAQATPPSISHGQLKLTQGRRSPRPPHTGGSGAPPQPLTPEGLRASEAGASIQGP